MIPSPRRTVSTPAQAQQSWADFDDDDGWQDMPVVRSDKETDLDLEDQQLYHYRTGDISSSSTLGAGPSTSTSNATGQHLVTEAETLASDSWRQKTTQDESDYTRLRLEEDEESEEVHMRTKYLFNEDKAMTPLSQMQATKELLTEGQRIAYVGLCQLVARRMARDAGRGWEGWKAKNRVTSRLKGKGKEEVPVVESANIWMIKIMARLYQHMEVLREEQHMIESLADHGVQAEDLVPALMTTHSVRNPEYDPKAAKEAELERNKMELEGEGDSEEAPPPPYGTRPDSPPTTEAVAVAVEPSVADVGDRGGKTPTKSSSPLPTLARSRSINPFGDDEDEEDGLPPARSSSTGPSASKSVTSPIPKTKSINPFGSDDEDDTLPPVASSSRISVHSQASASDRKPSISRLPSFDIEDDDDDGDIGRPASPPRPIPGAQKSTKSIPIPTSDKEVEGEEGRVDRDEKGDPDPDPGLDPERTPTSRSLRLPSTDDMDAEGTPALEKEKEGEEAGEEVAAPLPSLPGVSTTLTSADENVVLDIRWTVLCDLFLVLIADSVYDARSRAFLELVAKALGFEWTDIIRFENRVTEALEISEAVEKTEQGEIIEGRRTQARRKRYAMMGLAAAGGGLVIGLSAGLLAPVIGAGLGAAFATVGISGTTGFLAGAGGAAVITTTGVFTGANIAGRGMAKRTREVRTFEFRPIHNLKRVSCYICVPGFMANKNDDVTLPFSVLDAVVGDVFSVLWEPDMMAEMGSALKILTSEVLTSGLQQVLAATALTALMSAIQWPIILTKLGYLIDNPWSNALDRSRAAGLILADVIQQRHAGVRPISLIGFSLGARSIFYALVELAKNKAFGLVQDVFIFGTTVTASQATWLEVRSVVAGRFVNGFASNDWMLGYLFRATSGGLNTVAGLRAVDMVPGLENLDCTDIINGHMSYRSCMPKLLAKVGFPVSADHFDEPEDPDADPTVQERTIVNEAEEEAKKNRKKILGIFPRSKKSSSNSKPGSGTATPSGDGSASASAPKSASSTHTSKKSGEYEYDDDDDDLPPREEEGDIGDLGYNPDPSLVKEEEEAVKNIPKTAGFDFAAISKALGKDIDVDKLPVPPEARSKPDPVVPVPAIVVEDRPPLERAGSAPPSANRDQQEEGPGFTSKTQARSFGMEGDDDDMGDIAGPTRDLSIHSHSSSTTDLPSWDRPSAISPSPLATDSTSPGLPTSSFGGFNAWSPAPSLSPSTTPFSANGPIRSAPPARPHPAEFMANPFASGGPEEKDREQGQGKKNDGLGGFGFGNWGKKSEDPWSSSSSSSKRDDQWADKNPW